MRWSHQMFKRNKGNQIVMTPAEREVALKRMDETIKRFYSSAIQIGNHPPSLNSPG